MSECTLLVLADLLGDRALSDARLGPWLQRLVQHRCARLAGDVRRDASVAAAVGQAIRAGSHIGRMPGLRMRMSRLSGAEPWLADADRRIVTGLAELSEPVLARRMGLSRSALRRRAESILRRAAEIPGNPPDTPGQPA